MSDSVAEITFVDESKLSHDESDHENDEDYSIAERISGVVSHEFVAHKNDADSSRRNDSKFSSLVKSSSSYDCYNY
jgi:hypothetical protein